MKRTLRSLALAGLLVAAPAAAEDRALANPVKASPADDQVDAVAEPVAVSPAALAPQKVATVPAGTRPSYLRPAPRALGTQAAEGSSSLFRGVLAFGFIAALGAVALFVRKKRSGPVQLKRELRLHVLGTVQVGPKASVALLSVGHEALLIGVSENGVSALRTFGKDELGALSGAPLPARSAAAPAAPAAAEPTSPQSELFRDLLMTATRSSQAAPGPRPVVARTTAEDDDMPPHLAEMLRQSTPATVTARAPEATQAKPGESTFSEPEGQASELVRRFRGLHS